MLLRNKQEKLNKGIKILDSKEDGLHHDSMNMESEVGDTQERVDTDSVRKYGSFTDNEELGHSHYNESMGSIHNICIDPTSDSYIEHLKREAKLKLKPAKVPALNFAKLNRPDLVPSLNVKGVKKNK